VLSAELQVRAGFFDAINPLGASLGSGGRHKRSFAGMEAILFTGGDPFAPAVREELRVQGRPITPVQAGSGVS